MRQRTIFDDYEHEYINFRMMFTDETFDKRKRSGYDPRDYRNTA